jgi:oxygen-independent coproporphyrinogen III oxidase
MSNVSFVPATPADIPLLQRLAGEIWRAHYPTIISVEQIDYMLARMYAAEVIEKELRAGTSWELIRRNGEAVGFLSYSHEPAAAALNLHKLYLGVAHHGQGLGQAGLRRVMEVAAARGAREVSLYVNKKNGKAIRAYQRAGFVIAEPVVTDFGGGFVMDDYRMTVVLGSPSSGPEPSSVPDDNEIDATRVLGVYVHFPFCAARCPYCDFAVAVKPTIPHDAYADAVIAELDARALDFATLPLASIYFGGGTPGLWRPDALARVLSEIRRRFAGAPAEITVEANPGEIDLAHLVALHGSGVNRISFGAQAFQDRLLRGIGRRHDAAAIPAAFAAARRAGFDNLCADLMFGLPGQTMEDWRVSLDCLCALAPEHITAYALTVEANTRFGALERAGRLARPGDDVAIAMYSLCHEMLTGAGYQHYEISSFARPGRRAVHNSLYWTAEAYLGLGVGAASFRPLARGGGFRSTNPRSLASYLDEVTAMKRTLPSAEVERRSPAQLEDEALWLGLRMSDGVDRLAHQRRFGLDPLALPERRAGADRCVAAGWLEVTEERVRLTAPGFHFADEVAVRLGRRS